MNIIRSLYRDSLTLLTDLYQITMAYAYWKSGRAEREAVFHLFFRKLPFGSGFGIACGLRHVIDYLNGFSFHREDLDYLVAQTGKDGAPLFEPAFMDYLGDLRFQCDLDAVPEGTAVFPEEPLLRIQGPILQCQLLETPLLTLINFPSLVATKAARICHAAQGEPVLEFGLRRAQGIDGGVTASRAAYIGGCAGTSNVLAGKLFGVPVKGTHAHSYIMSFPSEKEAFREYACAMPNNCIFLVDTYDTLQGIRNAIEVAHYLRETGHEMRGIRLDSGDLTMLSKKARAMLDEAGFSEAVIVGSSDLDEYEIARMKKEGAAINLWGVGTRLATAYDQPALGGVYKLSAIQDESGHWSPKLKRSEEALKTTSPGTLQVRRFRSGERFSMDIIYDIHMPMDAQDLYRIADSPGRICKEDMTSHSDLLQPVFRGGRLVVNSPSIHESRTLAQEQVRLLPDGIADIESPGTFPVGLEENLYQLKQSLISQILSKTAENQR